MVLQEDDQNAMGGASKEGSGLKQKGKQKYDKNLGYIMRKEDLATLTLACSIETETTCSTAM